jgi:hypothetical protein
MPRLALFVPTLPALLSVTLIVGCGPSVSSEDAQKQLESTKAGMQKGEEAANAAMKKAARGRNMPVGKLGTKPGPVGE